MFLWERAFFLIKEPVQHLKDEASHKGNISVLISQEHTLTHHTNKTSHCTATPAYPILKTYSHHCVVECLIHTTQPSSGISKVELDGKCDDIHT